MRSFAVAMAAAVICAAPADGRLDAQGSRGQLALGAIAFTSDREGYELSSLYAVNADGSDFRLLAHDAEQFAWSPDGQSLAFTRDGDLYIYDVDRRASTRVASGFNIRGIPAWSPDGGRIAFEVQDGGIWIVNPSGGLAAQVTRGDDENLSWSPDGRRIAFVRQENIDERLWIVNADGQNAHRLTALNPCATPSWSPDSHRVAFVADDDGYKLHVVDSDTIKTTVPVHAEASCAAAAWAPDGSRIAFGSRGTKVVSPEGGAVTRASTHAPSEDSDGRSLSWSPTGRSLAIEASGGDLWLADVGTGEEHRPSAAFRFGYATADAQWDPQGRRSASLGGTAVTQAVPSDSAARGFELKTKSRVARISADHATVAIGYVSSRNCIELWEPKLRSLTRFHEGACVASDLGEEDQAIFALSLAGSRLAWALYVHTLHYFVQLATATAGHPKPAYVFGEEDSGDIVDVRGSGSLLLFELWRGFGKGDRQTGVLFRVRGDRPPRRIRADQGRPRLLDVNQGRFVLQRAHFVDVFRPDGALVRRFRVNRGHVEAQLAGRMLVILSGSTVSARRLDGHPPATRKLSSRHPRLAGFERNLVAYVAAGNVRVLRLSDASSATFATPRGPVDAAITSAGLFYSYRAARGSARGRVAFVPLATVLKRLR